MEAAKAKVVMAKGGEDLVQDCMLTENKLVTLLGVEGRETGSSGLLETLPEELALKSCTNGSNANGWFSLEPPCTLCTVLVLC
jgi:hypothetical protein